MPTQPPARKGVVLVFGTFDLLHSGHISFLKQAGRYGKKIVAVVARDSVVLKLKNKKPFQDQKARLAAVRRIPGVREAMLGDKVRGSYKIIQRAGPDIICLGYDQRELEKDLKHQMRAGKMSALPIIRLKPHKPETFKTSIIAKNNHSQIKSTLSFPRLPSPKKFE